MAETVIIASAAMSTPLWHIAAAAAAAAAAASAAAAAASAAAIAHASFTPA